MRAAAGYITLSLASDCQLLRDMRGAYLRRCFTQVCIDATDAREPAFNLANQYMFYSNMGLQCDADKDSANADLSVSLALTRSDGESKWIWSHSTKHCLSAR